MTSLKDIRTIYLTAYADELFDPAFESLDDAEKFVAELNKQDRKNNWRGNWSVKPIDLIPSGEYNFCLEEGCDNDADGYFFCAECLQKRQGSS